MAGFRIPKTSGLPILTLITRKVLIFNTFGIVQSVKAPTGGNPVMIPRFSFLKMPWSIQRRVRADQTEWQATNRYVKAYNLNRVTQELLFYGERPVRLIASLTLLLILLLVLVGVIPLEIQGWLATPFVSAAIIPTETADQLTYFSTLWSVQATLVALVYPIVIAFITVFLQRRPSAEAFVHVFLLDSSALVAGLSSISLVFVMTLQYVLVPKLGVQSLPMWVAIDGVWFLLNAGLTMFFLYRSVEFLRPDVQQQSVFRYLVSVSLPRTITRLYSSQVLGNAQKNGWIPAPSYGEDGTEDSPTVWISKFSFRKGDVQGNIRLGRPSHLIDVRLWPLRWVVSSWMAAARKWPRQEVEIRGLRARTPSLIIPMTPGMEYKGIVPLARVEAGPPINFVQRLLLRCAFVFKSSSSYTQGIDVNAILGEIEADARNAALSRDYSGFERAYETMNQVHELLLGASQVKNEDGTMGSWALLPDIGHFFEQPLHVGWSNVYRSVAEAAIDALRDNANMASRIYHIVSHLHGPELNDSPIEIREHILKLPGLFAYQLGNWWIQRVEEQEISDLGPNSMAILRPPLQRTYEKTLLDFVGAWENSRDRIIELPEESEPFTWMMARDIARLHGFHLKESARLLLRAISRGDRTAAEWFADVLVTWSGDFSRTNEPFDLYSKTDFITVEDLNLEWENLVARLSRSAKIT